MRNDDRHVVPLTLLAQVAASLATSGVLWWWLGPLAGGSALLGGRDASAKALLRSAWIGEIGKLALTALLFGVIFAVVRPISAPAVFAGFIAAQLMIFAVLAHGALAGSEEAITKS